MNASLQWHGHCWTSIITIEMEEERQVKAKGIFPDFLRRLASFYPRSFPCASLSGLPRWRAEDQNLGLIYTSPGRCCQSASDWSAMITWPEPWPLIGCQLKSDCCIIPGVCGPAPCQFSQSWRGNFTVNTLRGVLSCKYWVSISISSSATMPCHIQDNDVTVLQYLDIYQAPR